jgi:hypothetical protein
LVFRNWTNHDISSIKGSIINRWDQSGEILTIHWNRALWMGISFSRFRIWSF